MTAAVSYLVGLLDPATWLVLAGLPLGLVSYFLLPADAPEEGRLGVVRFDQADAD